MECQLSAGNNMCCAGRSRRELRLQQSLQRELALGTISSQSVLWPSTTIAQVDSDRTPLGKSGGLLNYSAQYALHMRAK